MMQIMLLTMYCISGVVSLRMYLPQCLGVLVAGETLVMWFPIEWIGGPC